MGDPRVHAQGDEASVRSFVHALLQDVKALERMIRDGRVETGVHRMGAEQEYFLVDAGGHVARRALGVLQELHDPQFTTEIALFNLESGVAPRRLTGDCLRRLEEDLDALLVKAREAAARHDAFIVLAGILPTLRESDLTLESMVPSERYVALNKALTALRGGPVPVRIKGVDDFFMMTDNVMLEGCNTSFQVHLQVGPEEFVRFYNVAQLVTAPLLAAAVNSPVLLGHRLWEETRVALFASSVDDRSSSRRTRGQRSRVSFGDKWIAGSVLDIFRSDIARFRTVLQDDAIEDALAVLDRGETPSLRALCLHNGTVWRWNRACYGVADGVAHLRIENRVLPAGPSTVDEVANAAFFYGLVCALSAEIGDPRHVIAFEDAKTNFAAAAQLGLRAQLAWVGGTVTDARTLILEELLPRARSGLQGLGVDQRDVDRYLGVLEERVKRGRTGARWMLESLSAMGTAGSLHERMRALTLATLTRQADGAPVHEWALATFTESADWRHGYRTVGPFMTRELFTVRPDDVVELAANLMDWCHIRHVPVEDDQGNLVGVVSHRDIVRLLVHDVVRPGAPVPVRSIMRTDVLTVTPETPTLEALQLMQEQGVGCLPVVSGSRLVGLVTERDFLDVAGRLLAQQFALSRAPGGCPGSRPARPDVDGGRAPRADG